MQTILIGPGGLEPDAVVPQCLDNQFVPDSLFFKMVEGSLDYKDPDIARMREETFRTEFIRSMIYSSQVVIQRAYLKSEFLYKNFLPEDDGNFQAFAQLIRDKAIRPFLFREKSLEDTHEFGVSPEGNKAVQVLLKQFDAVTCVRLAVDDEANEKACAELATAFGSGLIRLQVMDENQRNAMAYELFGDRSRLQEQGLWQAFNQAVDALAGYAFKKAGELRYEKKIFARNDLPRQFCLERHGQHRTRPIQTA